MPAPLCRDAFADVPEKLNLLDAHGQPEVAKLFDRLFDQLKKTDALAAEAHEDAARLREEAEARDKVLAEMRARLELLERHGELFSPEEPADYEVEESRLATGGRIQMTRNPYGVNVCVPTLNVKG